MMAILSENGGFLNKLNYLATLVENGGKAFLL